MLSLIFVLAIRDCDFESEEMVIKGPDLSPLFLNYHTFQFHVGIKQLLPSQSHNFHLNCFISVNIFTASFPNVLKQFHVKYVLYTYVHIYWPSKKMYHISYVCIIYYHILYIFFIWIASKVWIFSLRPSPLTQSYFRLHLAATQKDKKTLKKSC